MNLLFVHVSEGGEELLEVLRGSRIAVGNFGSVYESHVDSLAPVPVGDRGRRKGVGFRMRTEQDFDGRGGWSSFAKYKRKVSSAFQRSIQTQLTKAQSLEYGGLGWEFLVDCRFKTFEKTQLD